MSTGGTIALSTLSGGLFGTFAGAFNLVSTGGDIAQATGVGLLVCLVSGGLTALFMHKHDEDASPRHSSQPRVSDSDASAQPDGNMTEPFKNIPHQEGAAHAARRASRQANDPKVLRAAAMAEDNAKVAARRRGKVVRPHKPGDNRYARVFVDPSPRDP